MEELIKQLKQDIIEALSLEDVVPDDFDADTPLFVEGLGLDSIDALELILLMERKYGVKIEDPKERRNVLRNVRAMAECITSHRNIRQLMHSRVFVTGVGIISAIGNGTGETLTSFRDFRSGIGKLSLFDSIHADIPVAEVGYSNRQLANLAGLMTNRTPYTRNTLLALIAAKQAMTDSDWNRNHNLNSGIIMATTVGGMDFNEQYYMSLLREDTHKDVIAVLDSADCTEKVAACSGIRHHVTTISTACSSSANSIMLGARLIRNNRLDRVLVGGSDSLTRFTLNGFYALEILIAHRMPSVRRNRNGLTIGEGCSSTGA